MLHLQGGTFLFWERDDHRLLRREGDSVDGVAQQRHAARGGAGVVVVVDLQPECLEQPAREFGKLYQVDRGDRQVVEQRRVGCPLYLILGFGELALQLLFVGSKFGASLVDVTDEGLIDIVGDLQAADESLALGFGLGDRAPKSGDPGLTLLLCVVVDCSETGIEQLASIRAEDLCGEERGKSFEQVGPAPLKRVLRLRGSGPVLKRQPSTAGP